MSLALLEDEAKISRMQLACAGTVPDGMDAKAGVVKIPATRIRTLGISGEIIEIQTTRNLRRLG